LLGRIIEALDIVCTYIFGNFLGRVTTLEWTESAQNIGFCCLPR